MTPLKERLKSRKFIGSVVVFVTSLVLLLTGVIGEGTWAQVIIFVYGTYAGSNIGERAIDAFSGRSAPSES